MAMHVYERLHDPNLTQPGFRAAFIQLARFFLTDLEKLGFKDPNARNTGNSAGDESMHTERGLAMDPHSSGSGGGVENSSMTTFACG
jgi:hypothetical protein